MEQPSGPALLDVMQVIRYYTTIIFLSLAQGAVLAVIAYGFVAGAVCILIGPVFIPFLIVPNLEWLFWGWLKTLIQYAFYPVVGKRLYLYTANCCFTSSTRTSRRSAPLASPAFSSRSSSCRSLSSLGC